MTDLSFEPITYDDIPADRRPSLGQALVPLLGMVVFLSIGAIVLGLDPHLPIIWGAVLTAAVGRYWLGISWEELFEGIVDGIRMGMQAILILFTIYMLIATWTSAGTIPGLIYYGLEILTPTVFLPATAALATIVAFSIGSSWTTAGTLGVAFMGIGAGLGVPAPMTAGAILTGAYTGDKISPLSDTTNLAAAVTNTDLMEHVRTMRVGTGLAFAISLVLYAALGLSATGDIPAGRIETIQSAIGGSYAISPLVFVPLLVTFALALYGFPALPSLLSGVFAGVGTTIAVQGVGFTAAWDIAQNGTDPATGSELVNGLLGSSGLMGSTWTITIVVAALALGGLLERTGVIATIAHHIAGFVNSVTSLTLGTGVAAISMNVLAAEQYMSIVVPGMTLRGLYDDFDLESRNLSRAVEASGTVTSALIPWNAGGAYMWSVLGVHPFEYAPYYFLGFLAPSILAIMAVTGWQITTKDEAPAATKGRGSPADD
ncbi:Na+/H+ antiporter NhaC [Haloarchaeobius sp. HME9146]|uniref:arginine/ornithine antiporter ArcD n=1 Tax=Haloarchaeobius sp. HME9146 TaxID=2978732 RepID=UPI0021BF88C5|nr:Na+/H+ antiporter NhaC [Haloarchaeobius sp. HME9146]MCT9094893.1 Na+/H+ antiporter NhaC [Haloarchaeobius sp. HME9146]